MEKLLKYGLFFVAGVALNWVIWRYLDRHFGDGARR